jgi:hypothetical protein
MFCLSVLSVHLWAQSPAPVTPNAATTSTPSNLDDLNQLRETIAKQEEQIQKLQQSVEQQRAMLEQALKQTAAAQTNATQNASTQTAAAVESSAGPQQGGSSGLSAAGTEPAHLVPVVNVVRTGNHGGYGGQNTTSSPLSISIGNTQFTPFGFLDATFFWRSTNVGSGIGTNFAGIPFNNVAGGHLSEMNFSAQNSRIGLRVDGTYLGWKVLGYLESDFLFNNNANTYQITSNSAGLRLRNYFVDVNNGTFEALAGQDWSMLTPNRKGISPVPSDIFYTQNMDTNYQIGLVWTRAPQFRFIAHPNQNIAFGVAFENPQQYLGGGNGAGAATLPVALSSILPQFQYGPAIQVANEITNVPNVMPDIQAKFAYDGGGEGHAAHFEVAGFVSGFKSYILPSLGTGQVVPGSHTAFGGGGEVNSNIELFKGFRLVENLFASDGGGRYLFGSAPDFIVRPNGQLSLVKSYSTVDGIEWLAKPNTQLSVYYGGMYVAQNTGYDPKAISTKLATTATPATPLLIGYGYPQIPGFAGPSVTQNRTIQEITFDWTQTLWKNKNYGALALINQYSYVFRNPWYVPNGAPREAHGNMIWINLRYTLP